MGGAAYSSSCGLHLAVNVERYTMNARMIWASLAGAALLASPVAVSAATTKTAKPAVTNTCKDLKGQALKDCKAKAAAAKKAAKTK